MRIAIIRTNVLSAMILVALFFISTLSLAQTSDDLTLRDDFDSELSLDWEIVQPDPSHASLETNPGKLTITTQYGSLHRAQDTAKNLYFISPPEGMSDYVVTTCIEDFLPETRWQQAGLMFWDDDGDNFIKWIRDTHSMNYPLLNAYWESDHDDPHARIYSVEIPKEKFWLRVIKRGNLYQCLASDDGENFITYAIIPFNDGTPTRIGLVAINGPAEGDLPAQFDFFELRPLTDEEQNDPVCAACKTLYGKWKGVEKTLNGTLVTDGPETLIGIWPGTLVIEEDGEIDLGFTLDLESEPNQITLIARHRGVGKLFNGIFAVDDDELTVCLNTELNGPPPAAFQSVEDDGFMLLKLERPE